MAAVDICCAESEFTTSFVNYVDGDSRRQDMPCVAAPITKEQLVAACSDVEVVLLGPLHPGDIDVEALSWLGEQGVEVALDIQGYARKARQGRVWPEISSQMRPALRCARHIKVAGEELELLLACEGVDLLALMRAYELDEVVVTNGSRGGYVCRDGQELAFRAAPVDRALDPTGAGDVFFAAYLAQRQFFGASIEAAMAHAASRAAQQVEGRFIMQSELLLK
jgi:sugar/nucleoside kinase (ribokinase family)